MKTAAIWIFWIVIAIAAWRWMGPTIRDLEDRVACTYQNLAGDCMTQAEYIRMVAHDAAADAISELSAFCGDSFNRTAPRCAPFSHN